MENTKHDFMMFVTGVLEMEGTPFQRAQEIASLANEVGMSQEMTIAMVCVAVQAHTMRRTRERVMRGVDDLKQHADLMVDLMGM